MGLGRKLRLTPSGGRRRAPEKQTVGTVTASQNMLILQAFRALSVAALQKGAAWAEERLVGALWQSVPPERFGCCSPHLPGEIFKAIDSVLVNFSRCFPRFPPVLVNFRRFLPRFPYKF